MEDSKYQKKSINWQLKPLVIEKEVLKKMGTTGRGTEYLLAKRTANNRLKGLRKG